MNKIFSSTSILVTMIASIAVIIAVITFKVEEVQQLNKSVSSQGDAYTSSGIDKNNDNQLFGKANNIFVARIISEKGNKNRGDFGAETQFNAEVIYNIKGNLEGIVTVNQIGGYMDGKLYIFGGYDIDPKDYDNFLLKPGNTYLLSTRFLESENWHTVQELYTHSKHLISTDSALDRAQMESLAKNDSMVQTFESIYREIQTNSR